MSAPPTHPVARQLHIKLGVVQRTQKELAAYHAELAKNRANVDAMRARGADEFDIKKQVRERWRCARVVSEGRAARRARRTGSAARRAGGGATAARRPRARSRLPPPPPPSAQVEVLGETEVMIPDTMRRLAKGVDDLRSFLAASGGDTAVAGSETLAAARAAVAAAGDADAEEAADEEAI